MDTESGECFEQNCYIFSDKYFGDVQGNSSKNYAVTNGLFAYWPIAEYTIDRFGASSPFNVQCEKQQWFRGFNATVCERCCGLPSGACTCNQTDDVFNWWVRNHDDCTPFVARNPDEVKEILNTRNLLGTTANFDECTNADYINTHMDWQNCIEFEKIACLIYLGSNCTKQSAFLQANIPPEPDFDIIRAATANITCNINCTMKGFYFDTSECFVHVRVMTQLRHLTLYIR